MAAHVLIVEDEQQLARNISRFLIRQGYTTTVVDTIGAALLAVHNGGIDVVLLDVELSDGNGLDAYRRLCQPTPLPTIAMTGNPRPEYRQRVRELRLHGLLLKPFPLTVLAEQVRMFSRRTELRPALNKH